MNGEKDFVYINNIITLAKTAGFETFWFSNQGISGGWDTPIAKLAFLCDHKEFTKKGDYASMNYPDSILLPLLSKSLSQKSTSPRLFIIHTMGSHVNFEARLEHSIHYNYYNRKISAYIQTIEQTDTLLKGIYDALQRQGGLLQYAVFLRPRPNDPGQRLHLCLPYPWGYQSQQGLLPESLSYCFPAMTLNIRYSK